MGTNKHILTATSPAAQSIVAGPSIKGLSAYICVRMIADLQGATGGTLDVYLQGFDGDDWFDVVHFAQLAAAELPPGDTPDLPALLDQLRRLPVPVLVDCSAADGMEQVFRTVADRGQFHVVCPVQRG